MIELRVDTRRLGPGRIDHRMMLAATVNDGPLWDKEITFSVDAPFEVPDLANVDAFVIAALFPAMGLGGQLRVHGAVSRTLMRNLLNYQSVWCIAAPDYCRPVGLAVAEIDDVVERDAGPHPNAILAFSGGLDAMLALCRNVSGDAGPTGHSIGATMTILSPGFGQGTTEDSAEMVANLRATSARWDLPMAVVRTNIAKAVGLGAMSHGTWLASCLSLFAGRFDVGLLGSSIPVLSPGYEIYGSHPLLDPLLSGGRMSIRDDEGRYVRADKIALLTRYPEALEDLRVCFHPYRQEGNCCRCEKCIRTMLGFIAVGSPIPPAFPKGLRLKDIGIGMGSPLGLHKAYFVLSSAKKHGTENHEAIRAAWRVYRRKRIKVMAKQLLKRLVTGKWKTRWNVVEEI